MSDVDLYSEFLNAFLGDLARFADEGFHAHGRGAVLVAAPDAIAAVAREVAEFGVVYLHDASEYLLSRGGWPTGDAERYVLGYDPETELIVLIDDGAAGVLPYWLNKT